MSTGAAVGIMSQKIFWLLQETERQMKGDGRGRRMHQKKLSGLGCVGKGLKTKWEHSNYSYSLLYTNFVSISNYITYMNFLFQKANLITNQISWCKTKDKEIKCWK